MLFRQRKVTQRRILREWDRACWDGLWPYLTTDENSAFGFGRLTAFRSDTDWLTIFEILNYTAGLDGHTGTVYACGNRVKQRIGWIDFLTPSPSDIITDDGWLPDPYDFEVVLYGKPLVLTLTPEDYIRAGIDLDAPISGELSTDRQIQILRVLPVVLPPDKLYPPIERALYAVAQPRDLPILLQVDNWHEPVDRSDMPSASRWWQSLAQALVENDASLYICPPEHHNAHWSLWPNQCQETRPPGTRARPRRSPSHQDAGVGGEHSIFYTLLPDGLKFGEDWAYADPVDPVRIGGYPKCPFCGAPVSGRTWLPPHRIALSSPDPARWPDFLWGAGFDLMVSSRFMEAYRGAGLRGIGKIHPAAEVVSDQHDSAQTSPVYHLVDIPSGGARIDDAASDAVRRARPKPCAHCYGDPTRLKRIVIEPRSWDGSDLFFANGFPGVIFASERFGRFVEAEGLTGARLVDAPSLGYDEDAPGLWVDPEPRK